MNHHRAMNAGVLLSTADRRWLYDVAARFDGAGSIKAFLLGFHRTAHDWQLTDGLGAALQQLDDEELEWLCREFEGERRKWRRGELKKHGRKS